MTTILQPGDIVLHEGRAEEVLCDHRQHLAGTAVWTGRNWREIADCTPLNISTRDGWRVHSGPERPAEVGADDRVECVLENRAQLPERGAEAVAWQYVAAYRVVTPAAQPEPDIVQTAMSLMRADGHGPWDALTTSARESYLQKAVRSVSAKNAQTEGVTDSFTPRPITASELREGDHAKYAFGEERGVIRLIVDDQAVIQDGESHRLHVCPLDELVRIDPPPPTLGSRVTHAGRSGKLVHQQSGRDYVVWDDGAFGDYAEGVVSGC